METVRVTTGQGERLWQTVLGELEVSLSRPNYLTWFKNTRLLAQTDAGVTIGVPNVFVKQQLEKKYTQLIIDMVKKNGYSISNVDYKIRATNKSEDIEDTPVVMAAAMKKHLATSQDAAAPLTLQGLNDKYTFENFVVGAGNELAYAACQAIAAEPGTRYNPLFLYGGAGIGKTHLMQAVGNALVSRHPKARVIYITSEQFVKEFVEALRAKRATTFASYYRAADILIVDDVQFFAGKEKVQEEFFHTFNTLRQADKQIILSSDKPPKDIPTLEERLRSRFVWGMSIDMQMPDLETRCAIVQTKAAERGTSLEPAVAEFLATQFQANIRELEGALNRVLAFCDLQNLEPDLETVTSLIGTAARPKHVSAKQIIERCARYYQVPLEDLLSPRRDKNIVVPRQVAMYLLRSELHLSFPVIAHELGRKDHTTAIHSVEKIAKESRLNPSLQTALTDIKDRLYA